MSADAAVLSRFPSLIRYLGHRTPDPAAAHHLDEVFRTVLVAHGYEAALVLDPLSAVMVLVITLIGFLIHLYASSYMEKDKGYYRFFCYLNLFVFAMLLLVMGDNFLLMFVGWEGVGVCSYLLIGFWFSDTANAVAGKKAFVTNRVGDFMFILGLFWLYWSLGDKATMNFTELQQVIAANPALVGGVGGLVVTGVCMLFFGGATGKSAQIPLYVWLPDAMAGPTPVSALILSLIHI